MATASVILVILLVANIAYSKPEGYYHQQAEYHSSSSSFRNNELQQKTDDDSFYSESGDLAGRNKPKVNSHSEHSEYLNPKLRSQGYQQQSGGGGGGGGGIDDGFLQQHESIGLSAQGVKGHGGSYYDRTGVGSSYYGGSSSSGSYRGMSYGAASNLQELTQKLQSDLSRQLETAVTQQYRQTSYSSSNTNSQMQQDLRRLEEELKANLTRKLQEALYERYGQQSIRGPYAYTISTHSGNSAGAVNYNTRELDNLRNQVENNLLQELQQQVRTQYESRQSYNQQNNYRPYESRSRVYQSRFDTNRRQDNIAAVDRYGPSVNTDDYQRATQASDYSYFTTTTGLYPNLDREVENFNTKYQSSTTVVSLTDIVQNVQNELSEYIDQILENEQRKNLQLIRQGRLPNYTETFRYYKEELRRNLTNRIDEVIRRHYGPQIVEGEHSYSILPSGARKSTPSYRTSDLISLKQQIEDNLVEKLSYEVRQQELLNTQRTSTNANNDRYGTKLSSSASDSYANNQNGNFRTVFMQPVAPLSSSSQTSSGNYDLNPSPDSQVELTDIQRRLQDDLSRQLQSAISETRKEFRSSSASSYSSSGSHVTPSPATYQATLDELTEELKRNLTRKLQQQLQQQRSYTYGTRSGQSSYSSRQVDDLRSRLQDDLVKQLQDGLYQSTYSQYSSYSSSSNYQRPSHTKTGASYRSSDNSRYVATNADCDEGYGYRRKRSYAGYKPDDDVQMLEDPWMDYKPTEFDPRTPRAIAENLRADQEIFDYGNAPQSNTKPNIGVDGLLDDLTQNVVAEDFNPYLTDLAQQNEHLEEMIHEDVLPNVNFEQQQVQHGESENFDGLAGLTQYENQDELTQKTEDLTQQIENWAVDEDFRLPQKQTFSGQNEVSQSTESSSENHLNQNDEELIQQTEDSTLGRNFDNFQISSQSQKNHDLTRETENLTQQTENLAKQIENMEDTSAQLQEPVDYHKPNNSTTNEIVEDLTQTQQIEDKTIGETISDLNPQKLNFEDLTNQRQEHFYQQPMQGLTQQTEVDDFSGLDMRNVDEGDTQQTNIEDFGYRRPDYGRFYRPSVDDLASSNSFAEKQSDVQEALPEMYDFQQKQESIAQDEYEGRRPVVEEEIVPKVAYQTTSKDEQIPNASFTYNASSKPGFWKNIGNHISDAYQSVKDKAVKLKEKLF